MSASLSPTELADYCNELLNADAFHDYCPNGLQVDAGQPIQKVITGVTACQALIDAAVEANAQAILVHHGYFWKGESQPLTGMKGKRIRTLMQQGISLIAYHLPLDSHPTLGNNAALAEDLGFNIIEPLFPEQKHPVGNIATTDPISADELIARATEAFGQTPLHITPDDSSRTISRIGICSGGAQDFIDQASKMGCDAYISGEISERTTHSAREQGIHYFACGHHATERGGIKRLGEHVAIELGLEINFIDIANPA